METIIKNKNPKYNKIWAIVYPLIFLILGVGFILLGYFTINKSIDWVKTTAVITDIVDQRGTDGKTYSKAYVDYTVNSQMYQHILLDAFDNGFTIGLTINIKYNPSVPTSITYDNQTYFSVLYIVGGVLSGIGVLLGIFVSPKMLKRKTS